MVKRGPRMQPQASEGKRSMAYFVGLDVSVKETSVCIVDDAGRIVREARGASEPEALLQVLTNTIYRFKRIGLEAGPPAGHSRAARHPASPLAGHRPGR